MRDSETGLEKDQQMSRRWELMLYYCLNCLNTLYNSWRGVAMHGNLPYTS